MEGRASAARGPAARSSSVACGFGRASPRAARKVSVKEAGQVAAVTLTKYNDPACLPIPRQRQVPHDTLQLRARSQNGVVAQVASRASPSRGVRLSRAASLQPLQGGNRVRAWTVPGTPVRKALSQSVPNDLVSFLNRKHC